MLETETKEELDTTELGYILQNAEQTDSVMDGRLDNLGWSVGNGD